MRDSGRPSRGVCLFASVVALGIAQSALAQVAAVQVAANTNKKIVAVVNTTTSAVVETKVIEKNTAGTWVESATKSTAATTAMIDATVTPPPMPPPDPIINDCNDNGIDDDAELASGASDWDADGTLDICETTAGDLNLNGVIDSQDVSILLGWWGAANPLYGDLNGDNIVDAVDLGTLLARFGPV